MANLNLMNLKKKKVTTPASPSPDASPTSAAPSPGMDTGDTTNAAVQNAAPAQNSAPMQTSSAPVQTGGGLMAMLKKKKLS